MFAVVGVGGGECGGFEGGGVGVFFEAVEVGVGGVVDDFDAAGGVSLGDEVEAVGAGAVGEDGDRLNVAVGGVAVPCVDVVHGVVGAEEEVAGVGGEDDGGVGFFEDIAAGDAVLGCCDVVGKDGEVDGGVGVGFVAVAVFVDAATASLGVEDAVCAPDGGYGHGAVVALVVVAGVLRGEAGAAGGGFDDPLGVHGAEHDDGLA